MMMLRILEEKLLKSIKFIMSAPVESKQNNGCRRISSIPVA